MEYVSGTQLFIEAFNNTPPDLIPNVFGYYFNEFAVKSPSNALTLAIAAFAVAFHFLERYHSDRRII
jgi:hypothetical protein